MEDGVKEQRREPALCYKAGWLKKDGGRLLSSFKDCYVHVEKTELALYDSEEVKTCLERLDLENYDRCRELKSPFKRKQRLILIKSHKPGNKVSDVKFQAQNAEEKEAWIKALSEAINRAKNKYLDEVKTDKSLNLEHITRTRPKGNHHRRPPTRIHLKEVSTLSPDGTMHLDLVDAVSSNGTHPEYANVETSVGAMKSPMPPQNIEDSAENQSRPCSEEAKSEQDVSLVKKKIKPPMPPSKDARPSATPVTSDQSINKDLETPLPQSAEAQPCVLANDEAAEKIEAQEKPETSLDLEVKTDQPKPPAVSPPSPEETSHPRPAPKPPVPPSKGKKPVLAIAEPDQVVHKAADEIQDLTSSQTESESSSATERASKEASEEKVGTIIAAPPLPPKKPQDKITQLCMEPVLDQASATQSTEAGDSSTVLTEAAGTTDILVSEKEVAARDEAGSECVSSNDATPADLSDGAALSKPAMSSTDGGERRADSERQSDGGRGGSASKDALAAVIGLDVPDVNEDDDQSFADTRDALKAENDSQADVEGFACQLSTLNPPMKPLMKVRSASHGDLLLTPSASSCSAVTGGPDAASDDVAKLKLEVSMQVEKTNELLFRLSQLQSRGAEEDMSVDLLAEAMEKLKRADLVLTGGEELSSSKNSLHRKSW